MSFVGRASPRSVSSASAGSRRGFAISCEMSVRADDGGGGDTPGEKSAIAATESKIEAVEEKIEAVEEEIRAVGKKVEAVEAALCGGPHYLGITDRDLLFKKDQLRDDMKQIRKQLDRLQKEKEQLQKEKEQLREEKLRQLSTTAEALVTQGTQVYCL